MSDAPLVLAADDDPDILSLIQAALRRTGCEVMTAPDGAAALELARARPPVLALVDLSMPRMDGLELTRALRADPATADIIVIVLTAAVRSTDVDAALEAGADRHVRKPFSPRELRAQVEELLQGRQAGDG